MPLPPQIRVNARSAAMPALDRKIRGRMFPLFRAERARARARVDSSRARDNCVLTLTVTRNYRVLAVAPARAARLTFIDSIVH